MRGKTNTNAYECRRWNWIICKNI